MSSKLLMNKNSVGFLLQQQVNKMGDKHVEVVQKECTKTLAQLKQQLEGVKKLSANCDKWTGDTYKTEAAKWVDIAALIRKDGHNH